MISANDLFEELSAIPMLDAHTHINADCITARGLDDILLYHMVISDLYAAGCPDGSRLPDNPTEEMRLTRLEKAIPYIPLIKNTSCYWGVKLILNDLYGWSEDITLSNWRKLDDIIKERSTDNSRARDIMHKCGVKRIVTELWRGYDGIADDIFQYSLEWAFFTRSQWGQYDTALLELEHAWNQDVPGAPLPVTANRENMNFTKTINTLDDVTAAITHYCTKIPYEHILYMASHLSTDIKYRLVTPDEMEKALKNRSYAGSDERDIYANYIHNTFLAELTKMEKKLVLAYSLGAEPLPFETGAKLRTESIFEIGSVFARNSDLQVTLLNAAHHQEQAVNTLVRELPNVSVSGFWWHNFFPRYIRDTLSARLDMVPVNKIVGFFSDAYCMDWVYAKAFIVRKQMAEVLAQKIAQGQYNKDIALDIVKHVVYKTPQDYLGMKPKN